MASIFKCPICGSTQNFPFIVTPCGDTICQECLNSKSIITSLGYPTCPVCQVWISATAPNRILGFHMGLDFPRDTQQESYCKWWNTPSEDARLALNGKCIMAKSSEKDPEWIVQGKVKDSVEDLINCIILRPKITSSQCINLEEFKHLHSLLNCTTNDLVDFCDFIIHLPGIHNGNSKVLHRSGITELAIIDRSIGGGAFYPIMSFDRTTFYLDGVIKINLQKI